MNIISNLSLPGRYNLKPEMSFKQIRDIFQVTKEIDITNFINFNVDPGILDYQKYFGAYYNVFKRLGNYMRLQPMVESSALCSYTQCKYDELNLVNQIYKKYNLLAKVKNRPMFVTNTGKNNETVPIERLGLEDLIADAVFIRNNLGVLKHINIADIKFTTKRTTDSVCDTGGYYETEHSIKIGNIRLIYNIYSMGWGKYKDKVLVILDNHSILEVSELYLTLNGIIAVSINNKTYEIKRNALEKVDNFKPNPEDVRLFQLS